MIINQPAESDRKTLIFGIDGGTWDVLGPLVDRGVMPTLAELREKGAWGDLISVVPVNSAAAWSSILTGMPPASHGVYDFFAWHPVERRRTSVNATWLPRPTLLDLMGQAGPVLALKIPITYPPWSIRGTMVSGLPTPDDEAAFTHPPDLARHLNRLMEKGSAGISWELEDDNRQVILKQLNAGQRSLERLTDHLLKEDRPQICFVVARDVDELQHFFWDVLTGPDKHGYRPLVEDYFAGLDRYLTRLLDWAGEDARIILFSDHGFGPVEGIWHLNDWLRARGFLRLKAEFEDRTDRKDLSLSTRLNFALRSRLLRELKHLGMPADRLEHSLEKLRFRGQRHTDLEGIDWSSTLAYAGAVGEEWLPVYINLQGREPQGIVSPQQYDQIREDLRSALYSSEEPAVLVVHRAEEIFEIQDPRMTAAPDLIAETITSAVQSDFTLGNAQIYEKSRFRNGCHRRLGMFLLAGPEVVHQRDVAHLLDIPATILAWLGITPPTIFQGRIMHELIPEAPLPETETEIQTAQVHKDYFSEEDETGVRKKLESLGYL